MISSIVILIVTITSNGLAMPIPSVIFAAENLGSAQIVYNKQLENAANYTPILEGRILSQSTNGPCLIDIAVAFTTENVLEEAQNEARVKKIMTNLILAIGQKDMYKNKNLEVGAVIRENNDKFYLVTVVYPPDTVVYVENTILLRTSYAKVCKSIFAKTADIWQKIPYDVTQAVDIAAEKIRDDSIQACVLTQVTDTWKQYFYGNTTIGKVGDLTSANINSTIAEEYKQLRHKFLHIHSFPRFKMENMYSE